MFKAGSINRIDSPMTVQIADKNRVDIFRADHHAFVVKKEMRQPSG